jgi:hypothetical protein
VAGQQGISDTLCVSRNDVLGCNEPEAKLKTRTVRDGPRRYRKLPSAISAVIEFSQLQKADICAMTPNAANAMRPTHRRKTVRAGYLVWKFRSNTPVGKREKCDHPIHSCFFFRG